jgi:hypothetical protein
LGAALPGTIAPAETVATVSSEAQAEQARATAAPRAMVRIRAARPGAVRLSSRVINGSFQITRSNAVEGRRVARFLLIVSVASMIGLERAGLARVQISQSTVSEAFFPPADTLIGSPLFRCPPCLAPRNAPLKAWTGTTDIVKAGIAPNFRSNLI